MSGVTGRSTVFRAEREETAGVGLALRAFSFDSTNAMTYVIGLI